jgi:hypothetical protein
MRKLLFCLLLVPFLSGSLLTYGQLIEEENVSEVTMAMQPVLQLEMPTSPKIEFVFDNIQSYYGGITKYAATVLRVSSSISWDLYAVGTSQDGQYWDQLLTYSGGGGAGATPLIPLSALELRQYPNNRYTDAIPAPFVDYSNAFTDPSVPIPGQNSIYYNTSPYNAPADDEKYIQGHKGTALDQGAPGGSWLVSTPDPADGLTDFYFTIDYRILPGLPAVFPAAGLNDGTQEDLETLHGAGSYGTPGVYGMNVKFILLEDQ